MNLTLIKEDIDKALLELDQNDGKGICQTCCIAQCLKRNNILFTEVSTNFVLLNKDIIFALDSDGKSITKMTMDQWNDIKLPYEFSIKSMILTNKQLSARAIAKLDLAISYVSNLQLDTEQAMLYAKQATQDALAALVELTNRLNGNQPPKQDR